MKFQTILYEKPENAAWITLNRPAKLNAQNAAMVSELFAAFEDARLDDQVHLIVLTGNGRAFSSGADITEFPGLEMTDSLKKTKGVYRLYQFIRDIPKPVVAMVNGIALGGGCELAMSCDIIMASDEASFGQPEINVGAIPGGGGTQILPRLIGEKRAKELIFSGEQITAEEAFRMGLVNRVVPAGRLKEAVKEFAEKLAGKSPFMLGLAKLAVNRTLETHLSAGLQTESDYVAMTFCSEDRQEGAKAFMERRKPGYTGKQEPSSG